MCSAYFYICTQHTFHSFPFPDSHLIPVSNPHSSTLGGYFIAFIEENKRGMFDTVSAIFVQHNCL